MKYILSTLVCVFSFPMFSQQQVSKTGTVELIFTGTAGNDLLKSDSVYSDDSGNKYSVSTLKFFLSDIALSTSTGAENKAVSEKYKTGVFLVTVLKAGDQKKTADVSFAIEEGNYSDLRFNIGVPRQLNHSDPTMAPPPLDIGKADMYWTWNSGYIFFLAEGHSQNSSFHFAVGSDHNIMPVSFGNLFNIKPLLQVKPGQITRLFISLDFNKVLQNGNGTVYPLTSDDALIVHGGYYAGVLRNNIVKAFTFQKADIRD